VPTQFGDLIQYVDPAYAANVARLNAATLATLALAPGAPRNVRVLTDIVGNDTRLAWEPPAGFPADATFEIVSRDTSAPDWTAVQAAGRNSFITIPVSEDNTIFAVRSVDAAGHRSPAVYPTATRAATFPTPPPAK
jgi:hypothetical protein